MRTKLLIVVTLILSWATQAQVTGDYRSRGNTNIVSTSGWDRYNGSAWVQTNIHPFHADAVLTSANTININHTVRCNGVPGNLAPARIVINGTLNVDPGTTVNPLFSISNTLNTGSITINNNGRLFLANGKRLNVFGDVVVNTGGTAEFNPGDDSVLTVYGNYTNNGTTNFWKAEVFILGNLMSNTSSTVQNNGNIFVGGNIIGVFIVSGNGSQFYYQDPNAIVDIDIVQGNQNPTIALGLPPGYPANFTQIYSEVFGDCSSSSYLITEWNGSSWNGGTPTLAKSVVINGNYNGPSFSACNVKVNAGFSLTVKNGNHINVRHDINNLGTIVLENGGSLVQIAADGTFSGNPITSQRITRPMRGLDYVYFGSPMQGNVMANIPSQFDRKYRFNATGAMNGAWVAISTATPEVGRGFIARVRNSAPFNTTNTPITVNFNGIPNNGTINVPVTPFGGTANVTGNTVLLANPYPSAIDASRFVRNASNINVKVGTLYFWTANTLYLGTGSYNQTDYASWNLTGGTTTGTGTLAPNGKIVSGQGFFAQVFQSGNVQFDNSMRVLDQATASSIFFRTSATENNQVESAPTTTVDRFWLNLTSEAGSFRQMLVGYIDGATNEYESNYDGTSFSSNSTDIYTIVGDKNLTIQGRALPFADQDVLPLGIKIGTAGTYTITLDQVEGLFAGNQAIYVYDHLTQTYHNLKESAYTFTAAAGVNNSRLELRFANQTLSIDNPVVDAESVIIFGKDKSVSVYSGMASVQAIEVYDILGKRLFASQDIASQNYVSPALHVSHSVLIVKVTLDNDQTFTKKVILN
ncbi:T9SS sorting signal type C domain-containing protein [Flavobacterium sp.]|uniref:T9SS sorting signal type C domain-containing protein n=1 Tax=Flavobacterium sp. TaxID=239 RepID=UPI002FDA78D7